MRDLEGKIAFITGAASGIGLGLATVFGRARMRVVMTDVRLEAVTEEAERLESEGIQTLALELDVADRDAFEHAATRAEETFGQVDLVCNNAGVGGGGPLDQCSYHDWDWVMGVNLGGVVNGVQTFVHRLKLQGGGHFVNTASMAGLLAAPGLGIYNTTKYAVVGLSESMLSDLEPYGIGVSVLCPGFVRTRIHESDSTRPARYPSEHEPDAERRAAIGAMVEAGLDPIVVGEAVRDAVLANQFWVLTHPEMAGPVGERAQQIADAFAASASRLEALGLGGSKVDDAKLWRGELEGVSK